MLKLSSIIFLTIFGNLQYLCKVDALKGLGVRPAGIKDFPFIVSISKITNEVLLEDGEEHRCAGTLVTQKHVLTTALCREDFPDHPADVTVKMGSNNLDVAQHHDVKSWTTYADWAALRIKDYEAAIFHDIAIIELQKFVSSKLKLASIPNNRFKLHVPKKVVTAGWGAREDKITSKILETASLSLVKRDECLNIFNKEYLLLNAPSNILCTTSHPFITVGYGDSGGPLLVNGDEIIGINLGVYLMTEDERYSEGYNAHLEVDAYREFIVQVTRCYKLCSATWCRPRASCSTGRS